MKKMDARYRKALLNYYVGSMMEETGVDEFMQQLIIDSSNLIASIADRSTTPGLEGVQKNYLICQRIAELRIKLDQAALVWSADNIATFDARGMNHIRDTVLAHRAQRAPRREWPRCQYCAGRVNPERSHDFISPNLYTCINCLDN